jgi:methionyl-tRNA formyltransferase
MEAGLDTGPVLLRAASAIAADDNAASLHDRLAALGAQLIVEALDKLPLPAEAQSATGLTYAHKIEKQEALIDWSKDAQALDRHIRAFNPFPGAQTQYGGQTVKLWRAEPVDGAGEKGQILSVDRNRIVVACGSGALAVSELQKAGGKRLPVREFLAGYPLKAGDRFDLPA